MQALFGKRPTEKDPAKGTSPAVDFTLRGPGGEIPPGYSPEAMDVISRPTGSGRMFGGGERAYPMAQGSGPIGVVVDTG